MRSFGLEGIRKRLREHIALNEFFAAEIEKHPDFELVLDPILNFTCFRYKLVGKSEEELNELNEQLKDRLNKSGKLFLSHTKIDGKYVLRFVIGQTYVEKRHIENALELILNGFTPKN
ncbi:MAG: aspartate aminotransferase family protein, partial [Bacteroidetes bacterium]